jgi:hypothetical protein
MLWPVGQHLVVNGLKGGQHLIALQAIFLFQPDVVP